MGKTKRHIPKDGDFKRLKATSKKQRNKKQRSANANLQKHIRFASEHRATIDMTQMSAAVYMADGCFNFVQELKDVHCCDHTKEYCEQHRDGDGCNIFMFSKKDDQTDLKLAEEALKRNDFVSWEKVKKELGL